MDLQELVSITENLTDDCQKALWQALKEILFRKKGPAKIRPSTELERIVEIGILVHTDGYYAVSEMAQKKIRKLYTYLVRKFDIALYYDPDLDEIKEIPKGAEFVCTLSTDGSGRISLQFPDDEITAMLNLFGTNRCNNWRL